MQTDTLKKSGRIPIIDLKEHYKSIKEEINEAVRNVLHSGHYILGPNVLAFEKELAEYLNCKHVISCANGTDAILLVLKALGIKEGDEVITVSHTFFATAEAVALTGAKPVFVDIKEHDFNIDPNKIESLITNKTKVIIPVHLYGNPCDIEEVIKIAKKHKLYVIEDCAQSIGAKYKSKNVGTFGTAGTLSFFPTKNLGAFGDGGAVCTNDDEIAKKVKMLRVHGSSGRYEHDYIGINSRLDELQAAILRVELKYLDKWNSMRQKAAEYYNKLLSDIPEIMLPMTKPDANHVFHQYTIRTKKRDLLNKKLSESDIETRSYYPIPIHLQKAFSYLDCQIGSLPVTEKICSEVLSLPMYPEISTEIQHYIVEHIKKLFTGSKN